MSLDQVNKVKQDRGFKKWDVVVYAAVAALAAALFIAVFAVRDGSALEGVAIYVDNVLVFDYDFAEDTYHIADESGVSVEEEDGKLQVIVTTDGGYNTVEIEKSGAVRVTDADCGNKACVYMAAITDNGGIIYCSPHRLKIVPYSYDPDDGNIKI